MNMKDCRAWFEHMYYIKETMCCVLSEKCSVGQYYDLTTSRCQPCVKGFYQDEEAQFTCKPCPVTKSTDGTGSTSQAQCKGDCTNLCSCVLNNQFIDLV